MRSIRVDVWKVVRFPLAGLLIAAPAAAWAQVPATVQLPTYSFFSVGTSVSVPDRGSAYLGGVNRASTGSSEFGIPLRPFGNRSYGSQRSASSPSTAVDTVQPSSVNMRLTTLLAASSSSTSRMWPGRRGNADGSSSSTRDGSSSTIGK